ncbi:MAG: hypothetical protein NVS3B16_24740 [Vulcanimicrobiaceae bacterium]
MFYAVCYDCDMQADTVTEAGAETVADLHERLAIMETDHTAVVLDAAGFIEWVASRELDGLDAATGRAQ